ncbi:MAG: M12 family metallo-peptidase [Rhodothermales bacterium]
MITPSNATVAGTCFRVLPVGLAVAVSLLLASCDMGDCDDCGFDGTTVTVLVAYTSLAAQESGDIDAYVEKAMGETNEVFDNSETNVRLSMAGSMEVVYSLEDRLTNLARLLDVSDGFLDEIPAERDRVEADLVVLVTNQRTTTTNASIMATPETAYVIINRTDMGAPGYALAHEIGHLFGARHSIDADASLVPFAYGHGFRDDSLRTVVANGSTRTVLPYFSSPRVRRNGVVLGDSTTADVARVVAESAVYISNFRGPQTPTDFVPSGTWPVLQ